MTKYNNWTGFRSVDDPCCWGRLEPTFFSLSSLFSLFSFSFSSSALDVVGNTNTFLSLSSSLSALDEVKRTLVAGAVGAHPSNPRNHTIHTTSKTSTNITTNTTGTTSPTIYVHGASFACYRCGSVPKSGQLENTENVTLQKRPITVVIPSFWWAHAVC